MGRNEKWNKLSQKEQELLIDAYMSEVEDLRGWATGTVQDRKSFDNFVKEQLEVEYANENVGHGRDDREKFRG